MDLGIFQETKGTEGIYTHESAGYSVVATDASSRHRGGVAVFYQPSPLFSVEAVRQFGPNVVSFQLETVARRWYIIGCYLVHDDTLTVESVVTALKERPRSTALVVAGDLNTTLDDPENDRRGTEIAAALTEAGLEDMAAHFLPRRRRWGRERRTWSIAGVLDGLYPRDRPKSLLECVRPRPKTQHRPLNGVGVHPQRPQEGAC